MSLPAPLLCKMAYMAIAVFLSTCITVLVTDNIVDLKKIGSFFEAADFFFVFGDMYLWFNVPKLDVGTCRCQFWVLQYIFTSIMSVKLLSLCAMQSSCIF